MPSRLPRFPSAEPVDLRIAAVFVVLTLALVAPGLVRALAPADDHAVQDAASSLESQAREAVTFIDHRAEMTDAAFGAELQDLAGSANDARSDLLRQPIDPSAEAKRKGVADAASRFAAAADDASLAAHDAERLARDRATLESVIQALHQVTAGE
jgi:hypothetical protein